MKLLLRILGGLVVLIVLLAGTIYAVSSMRFNKQVAVDDRAPTVVSDSATVERGKHLAGAIAKCEDCHGDDFGGTVVIDGMPFARVVAPNLTKGRGGLGGTLTDEQIITAVRHGVGPTGRALALMPSSGYWYFGDSDVTALVAYLRSLPPVDRELPVTTLGPIGRTLLLAGKLDPLFEAKAIDHNATRPAVPAAGATAEYGAYLVQIGGCTGCHGPGLSGGPVPGGPPDAVPARNLTPEGIGSWSEEDFFRALREGKRPDGTQLNAFMPVKWTRLMTDDETRAILAYLRTVPAKPYGNR